MPRTALLLTTCAGLEDVVLDELRDHLPADPGLAVRPGQVHVWVEAAAADALAAAMQLRTVHHVHHILAELTLPQTGALAFIRDAVAGIAIPGLDGAESFGVRCRRVGSHDFTSVDAEREAGAGVRAQAPVPVDLSSPALDVRLDIDGARCLVGVRHTRQPLSRRFEQAVFRKSAAQPAIAAAMVRLLAREAGGAPGVVLDPFCGGGTLVLEAAAAWPDATLLASDVLPELAEGTRDNVASTAGSAVEVRTGDAADLVALWGDRAPVDAVLANPPFGKQLGRGVDLRALYGDVSAGLERILKPGGLAAVLVWKRRTFVGAMGRAPSLTRVHARVVEAGGLWVGIEIIRKRSAPPG
jgi:putative N6-adenine-specific DNA methylase/tRNA (guanine6-N2)-methyltransferase